MKIVWNELGRYVLPTALRDMSWIYFNKLVICADNLPIRMLQLCIVHNIECCSVQVVIFPLFVFIPITVNTKESNRSTIELNWTFLRVGVYALLMLRSLSPQGYSSLPSTYLQQSVSPWTQLKPKTQTKYKIENIFNLIFFPAHFSIKISNICWVLYTNRTCSAILHM